jgi:hypothetical protein
MSLNTLLELSNGSWAILGLFALYALGEYLFIEKRMRGLSFERMIFALPVSMQLGVALAVLAIGISGRSLSIWAWRAFGLGEGPDTAAVIVTTMVGCVGMLCVIRVVSRPRYRHRLWVAGLASVVAFVVATLVI